MRASAWLVLSVGALLVGSPARAQPQVFAQEILRLELEAQALRPMARALSGRSFGEDSIDALESHLAVTASLLLANEGQPEGEVRTAIEIGLSAR